MSDTQPVESLAQGTERPRIGFLGVGWIGRDRMKAIVETRAIEAAAILDPSPEMAAAARELAPEAEIVSSFEALLDQKLDGVVIATPSALHAAQSIAALERGVAVFCQKPLGRTRDETAAVVEAARRAGKLLAVDLSYRHTSGIRRIRDLIVSGELGTVFAVDLVFHNAYGPGKSWFYDKALSGGGCVIDLGVHLVDLLFWMLDFPEVARVDSRLFSHGSPIRRDSDEVEDYAVATIELASGVVARLACSWRLQAGCDAVIGADFYGTEGGASFRNVDGSFLDFIAERHRGTQRELLVSPPDRWGGRAAAAWARRLAAGEGFDPDNEGLIAVADVLDMIYGR
ncbi:Gfo/Idh/MocA family oxidoreductase [Sinorhizobium numidicum]|uniref:Gfo/Idh/MocA family oxidoreductase n=1 Tax=Sinorhizobium numidicum TaxID=680248 RepID=A0ABY8D527_9HYPH|nr:Gfo/Idh/MocA family oxidoreductase [Sinorhizobium numidicum]WEX77488.1 Gfo/Idh/MocA family oxidoreductase [Sinorhizobium numidicum]WEX84148.1 Gfo/Idh/MocA family oxidoreductase [Sinorhizobium numidicum]